MRPRLLSLLFLSLAGSLSAMTAQSPIPLWNGGAPGARGSKPQDIPTLTPFLPDAPRPGGAAMIICPGGGYERLADHEGAAYARWLASQGIACFVLKYRLGSAGYRYPEIFEDAERAIRFVRHHASEWSVDPGRIGIMGSSAGGHLASMALTHFDGGDPQAKDPVERESSRPDLGVLCYAVITMSEPSTHAGSRRNLLGEHPDPALVDSVSSEKQVRPDTPPCFLWTTDEDTVVPLENSVAFSTALRAHHIPFALHIYEKGAHGYGLDDRGRAPLHPWTNDLLFWLTQNRFLPQ